MIPATYDLALYRGDTGRWQFRLWSDAAKTTPVNLTGVTPEAMIRDRATNATWSVTMLCEVTLPNTIDVTLTHDASAEVPAHGVWDLQLTYPSGDVVTVLKGGVTLIADVTHAPLGPDVGP